MTFTEAKAKMMACRDAIVGSIRAIRIEAMGAFTHPQAPVFRFEQRANRIVRIEPVTELVFFFPVVFLSDRTVIHLDDAVEQVHRARIVRNNANRYPFGVANPETAPSPAGRERCPAHRSGSSAKISAGRLASARCNGNALLLTAGELLRQGASAR